MLRILLGNAIKSIGSAGAQSATTAIELEAIDGRFAKVTVRDSGPGTSLEIAQRLFDPFTTSKPRGPEPGFAIRRTNIEAHGVFSGPSGSQAAPSFHSRCQSPECCRIKSERG